MHAIKLYGTKEYPEIPEITQLTKQFSNAGYELYMVGGAVRDMALGHGVKDYDFTTNATPKQVQKLCKRVIPTGIDHGTVTVLLGAYQFEVTTYRVEGKYSDSRHPDSISFAGDLSNDLGRRDFTVNAMALQLHGSSKEHKADPPMLGGNAERPPHGDGSTTTGQGILVDLYGGMQDLKAKRLCAIGNPVVRFAEDPLRVLRGCRFAAQLDFAIEPKTFEAMKKQSVAAISAERIKDELEKTLRTNNPALGLRYMMQCGVLEEVFPEFLLDTLPHMVDQVNKVGTQDKNRWLERFTALCIVCLSEPDIKETPVRERLPAWDQVNDIMIRLKTSKKERIFVVQLYRSYYGIKHMLQSQWTDTDIRRLFAFTGVEFWVAAISLLGVLYPETYDQQLIIAQRLSELVMEGFPLSIRELEVDAADLMRELEKPPGPWLGDMLDALFDATLEHPKLNNRSALLALANELLETL